MEVVSLLLAHVERRPSLAEAADVGDRHHGTLLGKCGEKAWGVRFSGAIAQISYCPYSSMQTPSMDHSGWNFDAGLGAEQQIFNY
jgi:hypothetical protein